MDTISEIPLLNYHDVLFVAQQSDSGICHRIQVIRTETLLEPAKKPMDWLSNGPITDPNLQTGIKKSRFKFHTIGWSWATFVNRTSLRTHWHVTCEHYRFGNTQIGERRSSKISVVIERPDRYCGDNRISPLSYSNVFGSYNWK